VVVNTERCKGCSYCVLSCAKNVLYIDFNRRNSGGYPVAASAPGKQCSGCALCAEVCPDVALAVFR
jgi:2-oxoglutarate ferredoxin oxidoreductase subunit delta